MLLRFTQVQNCISQLHARVTLRPLKPNRQLPVPTRPVTSLGHPGLRVESRPLVMERPSKRARLSPDPSRAAGERQTKASTPLVSLHRAITPPPRSRSRQSPGLNTACPELKNDQILTQEPELTEVISTKPPRFVPSPVQLSHIEGFPPSKGYNVDTVRLRDILGDPMIRECWNFNYLFDVDFVMNQFDEDVRNFVQVKVVHGSWEREAANRVRVEVSSISPFLVFSSFYFRFGFGLKLTWY